MSWCSISGLAVVIIRGTYCFAMDWKNILPRHRWQGNLFSGNFVARLLSAGPGHLRRATRIGRNCRMQAYNPHSKQDDHIAAIFAFFFFFSCKAGCCESCESCAFVAPASVGADAVGTINIAVTIAIAEMQFGKCAFFSSSISSGPLTFYRHSIVLPGKKQYQLKVSVDSASIHETPHPPPTNQHSTSNPGLSSRV